MHLTFVAVFSVSIVCAVPVTGLSQSKASLKKELLPRRITVKGTQKLSALLEKIQQQSGNRIVDRRLSKDDPQVSLNIDNGTFWEALDELGSKTGIGFSPYFEPGAVALVGTSYRQPPVCYSGLFRIAVKEISVSRDFETGSRTCLIKLEVAWEPKLRPLFCGLAAIDADFATGKRVKLPDRGDVRIAGRNAIEMNIRLPAPQRKVTTLSQLKGKLSVLAPTKMLAFVFDNLETIRKKADQRKASKDGVSVTLTGLVSDVDLWEVDLVIDNPAGTPEFESHQSESWLANNRIYLQRIAGKLKTRYERVAPGGINSSARQATAKYFFTDDDSKTLSGSKLSDWSLVYVTPGPMLRFDVPFEFKKLPLP